MQFLCHTQIVPRNGARTLCSRGNAPRPRRAESPKLVQRDQIVVRNRNGRLGLGGAGEPRCHAAGRMELMRDE